MLLSFNFKALITGRRQQDPVPSSLTDKQLSSSAQRQRQPEQQQPQLLNHYGRSSSQETMNRAVQNSFPSFQKRSYHFLSLTGAKRVGTDTTNTATANTSSARRRQLSELRTRFVDQCSKDTYHFPLTNAPNSPPVAPVWAASFQPIKTRINEDRFVVQRWYIRGRFWRYLAVMDGHGGNGSTSSYAAEQLPQVVRSYLEKLDSYDNLENKIPQALREAIVSFDNSIGDAVKALCRHPTPADLSQKSSENLISNHLDVLHRAMFGSTLAMALLDEQGKNLWLAGVGDSTVALSYLQNSDHTKRTGERLLEHHVAANPDEYEKVHAEHPNELIFDPEGYVWGSLAMTRALGDYPYKFNVDWSKKLFFMIPSETRSPRYIPSITSSNKTPPYVIAEPSIRHIRLSEVSTRRPILLLFSDGIDLLAEGIFQLNRHAHLGGRGLGGGTSFEPSALVGSLLGETSDIRAEEMLGHKVEHGWPEAQDNKAVEVIGNMLGGTSVERWKTVLNAAEFQQQMYIDDATLIVCDLRTLADG